MHDSKLVYVPSTIYEVKLTPVHLDLIQRCVKHGLNNSRVVWTDDEYFGLIVIRDLLESYKWILQYRMKIYLILINKLD